MRETRLAVFPADYFSHIIVDEAHHVLSDGYQRVLEHFSGAKVLGVTATPGPRRRRNLGAFFETLAYEYKLTSAIKDGFLCRISAQTIPLSLDLTGVGVQNGDFKAGSSARRLTRISGRSPTRWRRPAPDARRSCFCRSSPRAGNLRGCLPSAA